MKVGRVIGNLTLSHADSGFRGGRFIVLSPQGREELSATPPGGLSKHPSMVAYDNMGAGIGDDILYVEGAEAMQPFDYRTPVDAICVAILDRYEYAPPSAGAA